jgi:hypothetical protein
VHDNLESQRRQYELADLARAYGFHDVISIDDDLGRSASGWVARPGFEALVAQLSQGAVGAVFCRRLASGPQWPCPITPSTRTSWRLTLRHDPFAIVSHTLKPCKHG